MTRTDLKASGPGEQHRFYSYRFSCARFAGLSVELCCSATSYSVHMAKHASRSRR